MKSLEILLGELLELLFEYFQEMAEKVDDFLIEFTSRYDRGQSKQIKMKKKQKRKRRRIPRILQQAKVETLSSLSRLSNKS
jgi:hypothetical protein